MDRAETIFNAKTQRRKGAKENRKKGDDLFFRFLFSLLLSAFAPLRLIFKYLCLFVAFAMITGCGSPSRTYNDYNAAPERPYTYTPPTQPQEPPKAPVVAPRPDVLIDAGHGGKDLGTHSEGKVFYEEKSVTLMTSKLVAKRLKEMGYNVSLTRRDDTFVDLKQRTHLSDLRKPKVFVSIHYNSAPSPKAKGIEVFYYEGEKQDIRSRASKLLAQDVLDSVVDATKMKSRGVKNGNLHVIRENSRPAILIEAGFMTNQEERQQIYSKAYQEQLAQGIAKGIDKYLKRSGS